MSILLDIEDHGVAVRVLMAVLNCSTAVVISALSLLISFLIDKSS